MEDAAQTAKDRRCRKAGRRFAVYCEPMSSAIAAQTDNGKGLAECAGFVEGVEGAALLGVVYRPRANTAGFLLNACPWCGESLQWWPKAATKPVEAEVGHG
jgi:hypothetical protein